MAKKNNSIKPDSGKTIKIIFDASENKIIVTETEKLISIDLKLKNEKRRRHVGFVTKSTRTLNVLRRRGDHLHKLSSSYGFNHKILEISKRFDTVCLQDEYCRWKIPKAYLLEHTNFLFFKKQGFELQTFISLEQLKQFEVKPII